MRNKITQRMLVGVVLAVAVVLVACPPGSRYQKAAQASKDFALAVEAFQNVVIAMRQPVSGPPLIDQDESNRLQNIAASLAKIDMGINDAIGKANEGQSTQTDIDTVLAEAQVLDTENLDWVKNTNAKATLQISLATARVALRLIQTIAAK